MFGLFKKNKKKETTGGEPKAGADLKIPLGMDELSKIETVEVLNADSKEDKIDKKQSVILFEDTENPYEKTFIEAEFDGKVLVIEATTVEYDGSYGNSIYVKNDNVDKLCRCAGIDKGDLMNWIESNFTEESADYSFRAYCRRSGIEFEMYG